MVHLYYYIYAGSCVNAQSQFYVVGVGSSKQANSDYLYLVAHAADHGHYFEIRSAESSEFFSKCMRSVSNDLMSVQVVKVSARDLVRALKAGNLPHSNPVAEKNRHELRMWLDAEYRALERVRASKCPK